MRSSSVYTISDVKSFKIKMLNWASRFGIFLYLDSNEYTAQGGQYECLLGAGALHVFKPAGDDMFEALQQFQELHKSWLFGHISYEVKDILEPTLSTKRPAKHTFPLLQFVVPEVVVGIEQGSNQVFIESATHLADAVFDEINNVVVSGAIMPSYTFKQRIQQPEYLQKIAALREHIRNGDCYEINFCNEGYCEAAMIDPVAVFQQLNAVSPAPFAACYKLEDQYLLSASPERYLSKQNSQIISQPIKGTARRSANSAEDEQLKTDLFHNEKERAENVMIVDLVRNDLARSCMVGSVQVDELFGIYTFPQVHQMISTVTGKLKSDKSFADAIKNSFPMGSMTGAPKVKVMELIEEYEAARRGLFAGTIGYISPAGNFDFNVVIRSLFYNAASKYLSYQTGGAITWDSDPQSEWDEMRLKAGAMERIFR